MARWEPSKGYGKVTAAGAALDAIAGAAQSPIECDDYPLLGGNPPHEAPRSLVLVRALSILIAVSLALVPGAASATTFTDVTIEDLARASDLVIIGRVEHVDVHPQGPAGQPGIHTRAVVQVAETLRGEHRTIVEVWAHGGRIGNRMRVVPGQATFRAGEDVALFLFDAGGGLWPTGMGRGEWSIQPGNPPLLPERREGLRLASATGSSIEELRTAVARAGSARRGP